MKKILSILIVFTMLMSMTAFAKTETENAATATLSQPEVIEGIPTSSENFHIYLCIGQSNMVGADKIKNADIVKVDGAYLYNSDSKWEVAQPYPTAGSEYMGFNRYSTVSKGSGRMGPTVGFARGMAKKVPDGVKIGIISNAISGTTVEEWSKGYGQAEDLPLMTDRPDRNLYEKAVERTKEALKKGGVLKGIFYLQGESCASKKGFMERLAKIGDGIREDIGVSIDEVPFFVSEIPQVRASGVKVIRTAPEHIKNCYVIPSVGLTLCDNIHFDYISQRKLGLRFAETALSKVYGVTAAADDMYKEIYGEEAYQADYKDYTVFVNDKPVAFDVLPIIASGRLYVPVRAIYESLGGTVEWDDKTQTVTGKKDDKTLTTKIGDEHITVNQAVIKTGLAPMLKDSRTLVPISFIEEGMDVVIEWVGNTQAVIIRYTEDEVVGEFKPVYSDIENALTIYGIKQSGDDGTNSIINILDGDPKTKWALNADENGKDGFGIIDLGSVKTLDKLHMSFQAHAVRLYTFSILVSENGTDYVTVIDRKTTTNKEGKMEVYDMAGIKAKYVKFVGHGNNQNGWNNLAEIVITGK